MPEVELAELIQWVRGEKVLLDRDLARLYQVEVKVLNQSVKRNASRFPGDFMFQLTETEADYLRSQSVTLEGAQAVESPSRRTRNCRRSCMTWKRNTTSNSRLCSTPSGN